MKYAEQIPHVHGTGRNQNQPKKIEIPKTEGFLIRFLRIFSRNRLPLNKVVETEETFIVSIKCTKVKVKEIIEFLNKED